MSLTDFVEAAAVKAKKIWPTGIFICKAASGNKEMYAKPCLIIRSILSVQKLGKKIDNIDGLDFSYEDLTQHLHDPLYFSNLLRVPCI